jgi:hypothetical protein
MKLSNEAQVLLDRYLLAVRRDLPGKKGADITEEIRSFLLDNLEGQFPKTAQISAMQATQMLEKLGSPRKLASQYSPHQYLIGPRFFPVYLLVLKIVVPAVVGALTLALIIGALAGKSVGASFPVLEYLGTLWNGAFMSAAFVTLVFAILERLNMNRKVDELEQMDKFDVNDLPQLSDAEKQPSVGETIFEMVAGVLGLAFFTYILNSGGTFPIVSSLGSMVKQIPVFTAGFMRFVPVLMVLTGLGIARGATLLVQGRRTSLTTWWQVADEAAHFVVTVFMLGAFPLFTVKELLAIPFGGIWDLSRVDATANLGLFIILVIGLVGGSLVTIIRAIRRELKNPAG